MEFRSCTVSLPDTRALCIYVCVCVCLRIVAVVQEEEGWGGGGLYGQEHPGVNERCEKNRESQGEAGGDGWTCGSLWELL